MLENETGGVEKEGGSQNRRTFKETSSLWSADFDLERAKNLFPLSTNDDEMQQIPQHQTYEAIHIIRDTLFRLSVTGTFLLF